MLLKCRCGALHNPALRWAYGCYDDGTANEFFAYGKIKPGHCPICRRAPVVADANPVPRGRMCM